MLKSMQFEAEQTAQEKLNQITDKTNQSDQVEEDNKGFLSTYNSDVKSALKSYEEKDEQNKPVVPDAKMQEMKLKMAQKIVEK